MLSKSLWACLLVLSPTIGFAQSTPHLYVGAAATLFRFAPFESYATTYAGPAVTVGVAFSPRWALEASVQYERRDRTYSESNVSSSSSGSGYTYNSTWDTSVLLVPLLARYSFTSPASPLHVDGLGGLTWSHSTSHSTSNFTADGQSRSDEFSGSANGLAVTLGPQLRYSFTAHFDAKLSLPVNLQVNESGAFGDRLYLTPQLGVQYAFGQ